MALPPLFRSDGCLDEGIHETNWIELAARFGYTPHRRTLLAQLLEFCQRLQAAHCGKIYIDGSFVTNKQQPGDVDVCFDVRELDEAVEFPCSWAYLKNAFPLMDIKPDADGFFLNGFQKTRQVGMTPATRKGIVCLYLDTLPQV